MLVVCVVLVASSVCAADVDGNYKGTVSPDKIDLEASIMDMPLKLAVTRAT